MAGDRGRLAAPARAGPSSSTRSTRRAPSTTSTTRRRSRMPSTTCSTRELVALEQASGRTWSAGSRRRRPSAASASEMFEPVEHLQRLYSLDNAFDEDELTAWLDRVEKGLGALPDLLCELKIDGLAVDAVYVDGRLRTLATRGDGRVGEDVTYNGAYIASVPAAARVGLRPARAAPARGARRGLPARRRLRADQLRAARPRPSRLRQSRATPPPARCASASTGARPSWPRCARRRERASGPRRGSPGWRPSSRGPSPG